VNFVVKGNIKGVGKPKTKFSILNLKLFVAPFLSKQFLYLSAVVSPAITMAGFVCFKTQSHSDNIFQNINPKLKIPM
jgi:hypothetical protein